MKELPPVGLPSMTMDSLAWRVIGPASFCPGTKAGQRLQRALAKMLEPVTTNSPPRISMAPAFPPGLRGSPDWSRGGLVLSVEIFISIRPSLSNPLSCTAPSVPVRTSPGEATLTTSSLTPVVLNVLLNISMPPPIRDKESVALSSPTANRALSTMIGCGRAFKKPKAVTGAVVSSASDGPGTALN
jgi:hypothetical protein